MSWEILFGFGKIQGMGLRVRATIWHTGMKYIPQFFKENPPSREINRLGAIYVSNG